jgi:hypothetical protein
MEEEGNPAYSRQEADLLAASLLKGSGGGSFGTGGFVGGGIGARGSGDPLDEGVIGDIGVSKACVLHAGEDGDPAEIGAFFDGGVQLDHAVEEMIVVDGEELAALGIGGDAMGGVPVGLGGGLIEDAVLGFAKMDATADVFLGGEGGEFLGCGAGSRLGGVS